MIRLSEMKVGIIKVMTHFVQEGAEKCLEGYNLAALCCPHPYLNGVTRTAAAVLCIEAVEFAAAIGRPYAVHVDIDGAHPEPSANVINDFLGERLDSRLIIGDESCL